MTGTPTMGNADRPRYLSLQTAADLHDVSVKTIRRRISDGTLPGYRIGGQLRVRDSELGRLVTPVTTARAAAQ